MDNGVSPFQRNQRKKPVLQKLVDGDKSSNISSPLSFLEFGNNSSNLSDILQTFYRSPPHNFRSPTPKVDYSECNDEISTDPYLKPLSLERLKSVNGTKKSDPAIPNLPNRLYANSLKTNDFKANFFLRLQSTKMENTDCDSKINGLSKSENIQPILGNKRPKTAITSRTNDNFYYSRLQNNYKITNSKSEIMEFKNSLKRPSTADNQGNPLETNNTAHNVMPVVRTPTLSKFYVKSFKSDSLIYNPNKNVEEKKILFKPDLNSTANLINSQTLYQQVKKEVEEYRQQKVKETKLNVENNCKFQPISPEEIFKEKNSHDIKIVELERKDCLPLNINNNNREDNKSNKANEQTTFTETNSEKIIRPKSVTFNDEIETRSFIEESGSDSDDNDADDNTTDDKDADEGENDDCNDDDNDEDDDDDQSSTIENSADQDDNESVISSESDSLGSDTCSANEQNIDNDSNNGDKMTLLDPKSQVNGIISKSTIIENGSKSKIKTTLLNGSNSDLNRTGTNSGDEEKKTSSCNSSIKTEEEEDDGDDNDESESDSNFRCTTGQSKSSLSSSRPQSALSQRSKPKTSETIVTNGSSSKIVTPSTTYSSSSSYSSPISSSSSASPLLSIANSSTSTAIKLISNNRPSKSAVPERRRRSVPETKSHFKSNMSIRDLLEMTVYKETQLNLPLIFSKFPNVPPVINFVTDGEKIEQLPWQLRKLLKWRTSLLTPIIVKQTITRSGFRPSRLTTAADDLETTETGDWSLYFGKHMKGPVFKSIKDYQKVNHFPGSFQLGRKDRLWRNIYRMQQVISRKEFDFIPQTFCLPTDLELFKQYWEGGGNKHKWIIKPPASARGIGVKVVHKWNQIPKRRPVVVQRYISNPYLINDSKFDLRLYVFITCIDPLRIYLYEDGLVRFASTKYTNSLKSLHNRYVHLTNYSINKMNIEYLDNNDNEACKGHKWSLKSLWNYMKKRGINTDHVWQRIKELVVKTVISAEEMICSSVKSYTKSNYSVQELFGFDVILDDSLKPWILEVNVSPSLHSDSPLDVIIKGGMIKDMFNISGFSLPEPTDVEESTSSSSTSKNSNPDVPLTDLYLDRRFWLYDFSANEEAKHKYFIELVTNKRNGGDCHRFYSDSNNGNLPYQILNCITPGDARILLESYDEYERRGNFERVYPVSSTNQTKKLLSCFESIRYSNLLLAAFFTKNNRSQAIKILESLCQKKLHLLSANRGDKVDSKHIWSNPSYSGDY